MAPEVHRMLFFRQHFRNGSAPGPRTQHANLCLDPVCHAPALLRSRALLQQFLVLPEKPAVRIGRQTLVQHAPCVRDLSGVVELRKRVVDICLVGLQEERAGSRASSCRQPPPGQRQGIPRSWPPPLRAAGPAATDRSVQSLSSSAALVAGWDRSESASWKAPALNRLTTQLW